MKQAILINKIEYKVGKSNNPFIRINGEFTVFDKPLIDNLSKLEGKNIVVEVESKGQWKNIREYYPNEDPNSIPKENKIEAPQEIKETFPVERPVDNANKTRSIQRMNALRTAVQYWQIHKTKVEIQDVFRTAETMVKWINEQ